MPPRFAVGFAAVLNFVGAFISLEVAATVAKDVVEAGAITPTVVFAGLIGAIAWNLATWWFGLPSSSSHALIGGVVGATFAAAGVDAVLGDGVLGKVLIPALIAPTLAFVVGVIAINVAYGIAGRERPGPGHAGLPAGPGRLGRPAGAGPRNQRRAEDDGRDHARPDRERNPRLGCRGSLLGGRLGGDRDLARHLHGRLADHPTMGTRIIKMDTAQGFSAQGAGAAVILASTHYGFPLSTTQVISGGVMGAGAGKRVSAVRWGVAGNIVVAWLLTLPAAAAIGAVVYGVCSLFGDGAVGPVVVSIARHRREHRALSCAAPDHPVVG